LIDRVRDSLSNVPNLFKRLVSAPTQRQREHERDEMRARLFHGVHQEDLGAKWDQMDQMVEEKFPKENFRVNHEMRDEILVYDPFLSKF
jgi:hypothetical protein